MQTRGACSCEWTKKAVACEKASAVERAGDAVEKVAAADNPRARGILSTRMGSTTTLPDSCKRSCTTSDSALIFWIKSLAARTMAFATGSNAVSCNSDSNCCVGDSTCFVTPHIQNKSVIGEPLACAFFFASFLLVDSGRPSTRVATCLHGFDPL